jgi:hypothetical protein
MDDSNQKPAAQARRPAAGDFTTGPPASASSNEISKALLWKHRDPLSNMKSMNVICYDFVPQLQLLQLGFGFLPVASSCRAMPLCVSAVSK